MPRRKESERQGVTAIDTADTTVVVVDTDHNPLVQIDGAAVAVVLTEDGKPRCLIRLTNRLAPRKQGRPKTKGVK